MRKNKSIKKLKKNKIKPNLVAEICPSICCILTPLTNPIHSLPKTHHLPLSLSLSLSKVPHLVATSPKGD